MYYLENRYQDEGWHFCADPNFPCSDVKKACNRAKKLSKNAIAYGMTRVVDKKGKIYGTYTNGHDV